MFVSKPFSAIDLGDPFFKSLKEDYREFPEWFDRKATAGEEAYVSQPEDGKLDVFLYLKREECEAVGDLG